VTVYTAAQLNDLIIKLVIAEPDQNVTQDNNLAPDYNKADYQFKEFIIKNLLMREIKTFIDYYYNDLNCNNNMKYVDCELSSLPARINLYLNSANRTTGESPSSQRHLQREHP
jgi:hypothetical protein